MLAAMHDELAEGDLVGFGKGIAQHGVAFVGIVTSGKR
jgi:hypothetical protein